MTTKQRVQRDQERAREELRAILKPGDIVYTDLRHVSASGMTRWIDVYVIRDDRPQYLTAKVALATGEKFCTRGHEGVEVGGCGMDMGFHLVYELSRALFPDGFDCIDPEPGGYSRVCPANDHNNHHSAQQRGEVTPSHHRDGGYALLHRWL